MPVINGVYLKDFPALPSSVTDANIIPIAISGNQIAYRTTVAGIVTDARVTSKLLTGLSVTGSTILATDTILQAFGKVQNQLNGKVSSVGLTMPAAFNVANSPITSAGTLAVTAAGVASQYIRGDGALADFPTTGGGGSSVSYYLNGSVSQGTIGGNAYYEMNKTPVIGTGTDFTIAADGYIAQFITDANDPGSLLIPGGNWNVEMYFSASSSGGTPSFYVEVYKYDGSTFTLLGSSATTPEGITNGTAIDIYYTSVGIPETVLTITDRLAIRVYVTHSGRTITLHTEDNHLSEIVTTFSNGLTALNGLTKQTQYFATGTTGTDFNISSSVDTHTFNIPDASATARGLITTGTQTFAGDKTFTGTIKPNASTGLVIFSNVATTNLIYQAFQNNGGAMLFGISSSAGSAIFSNESAYASVFGSGNATPLQFATNNIVRATFSSSGNLSLTGALVGTTANFTGQLSLGSTITNGTYTYTLPSATGTLALTSDIHSAVTLSAIGSTPNANAATLTGQILNLEPASASFGGVVTTGTQTFAGDKTLTGSLYGIALSMTGTVGDIIGSVATTGKAIRGTATTGFGVYASATTGTAIYGESTGIGGAGINGTAGNGIGGYFLNNATGFATLYVTNNGSGNLASFSNSAGTKFTINNAGNLGNGTYTYTLPSATGTLALTSALSSYLPLSGGTLTGALSGTSATFSGLISGTNSGANQAVFSGWNNIGGAATGNGEIRIGSVSAYQGRILYSTAGNTTLYIDNSFDDASAEIKFRTRTSGTAVTPLILTGTSATFSGSLTGTTATFSGTSNSIIDILTLNNTSQTSAGVRQLFNNGYGNLAGIRSYQADNGAGADDGILEFQTATNAVLSTKLTILETGNVGIGTTSPTAKLQITSTSAGAANVALFLNNNSATSSTETRIAFAANTNDDIATNRYSYISALNTSGSNGQALIFATNETGNAAVERLRIASTGAATFSSSVTATGGLISNGGGIGYGGGELGFAVTTGGATSGIYTLATASPIIFFDHRATSNTGSFAFRNGTGAATTLLNISGTGVVTINNLGSGTVTATSGVLSAVSDMNLKIEDGFIDNALEKVLNLKPRYFHWNEESGLPTDIRQLGFYAQEVNEALGEEAANSPKTKNENWGIYDRGIIAMLTKAIQELKAEIDLLKGEPIIPTDNNLE